MNLKLPHISPVLIKRVFFLFFLFCTNLFCFSQNMPVPENIQAALLPKVLKFSPDFSSKNKIKILIVYDNNSMNSKDEFVKELGNSMIIRAVRVNDIEKFIFEIDLVYFMPGLQDKAFLCKKHKVLSVTGISQYVEQGLVSLGFGLQNNKPKILVNINSLENEGQSLSSDLLRIAIIFK